MLTMESLRRDYRDQILAIAAKHGARDLRVFGSVARGEAKEGSDLDLLVDFDPDRDLFDHVHLMLELQELLGVKVDIGSAKNIHWYIRDRVLNDARAL
jgi:predicted nucleotidyltransferase